MPLFLGDFCAYSFSLWQSQPISPTQNGMFWRTLWDKCACIWSGRAKPSLESACPTFLSTNVINTRTKSSIGSQEFISHYDLEYITEKPGKKFKIGTSKQRPWRNAAYCLPPHGLLTLLSYTTQDRLPRGGITWSSQRPLTLIINQENGPQTFLQSKLIGEYSQLSFPRPRWL